MKTKYLVFCLLASVLVVGGWTAPLTAAETSTKTSATPTTFVNLNTATEAQLAALPGIGEATAKRIINGRPYASIDDLKKLKLSASQLEEITPLLNFPAPINSKAPTSDSSTSIPTSSSSTSTPASSSSTSTPNSVSSTSTPTSDSSTSTPNSDSSTSTPNSDSSTTTPTSDSSTSSPISASTAKTNPTTPTLQAPPQKGVVWVNLSSKVYYYKGDPYYGKTRNGKYMTEADAIKAGFRSARTK